MPLLFFPLSEMSQAFATDVLVYVCGEFNRLSFASHQASSFLFPHSVLSSQEKFQTR